MMWIIDVMMGFALGYLYAFLKYKKQELEIITKETMENHEESADGTTKD